MKKAIVVGATLVLLLVGFFVAQSTYQTQQVEQLEAVHQDQSSSSAFEPAHAMTLGPPDAKVVLVEFFDPGCETCRAFSPIVKQILDQYPGKIRLVYRYAPFHQGADKAVAILEAARRQGKYFEVLDLMYDRQQEWASHHHPNPAAIWGFLPDSGVDVDRVKLEVEDPAILELIRQDMADAKELGVRKTPSFFVNGKPLERFGAQQLADLVKAEVETAYPSDPSQ